MKTNCLLLLALLLAFGCTKDNKPAVDEFVYDMGIAFEYNTAVLQCAVHYEGTVKELLLHYSKHQDLSDELTQVMEYNSLTRCFESKLRVDRSGRFMNFPIFNRLHQVLGVSSPTMSKEARCGNSRIIGSGCRGKMGIRTRTMRTG